MGFARCSLITLLIATLLPFTFTIYKYMDQREFNYNSTADDTAKDIDLTDKVIIVTGSNTGIGLPTARVLLHHGATVIMACRNMAKARTAVDTILTQIHSKMTSKEAVRTSLQKRLQVINLDLGSFKSIDKFVSTFKSKNSKLNYLILNAGLQKAEYALTTDGIEQTFGINHIGNHYLTMQLTPLLIKTAKEDKQISRVMSVASWAHHFGAKPVSDLLYENVIQDVNKFDSLQTYGFSKACNILFAKEYNERYSKNNVYAVSIHPGTIPTELAREHHAVLQFMYNKIIGRLYLKTVEQGAATTLRTVSLTDEEFKTYGGSYFSDCNEANGDLRDDLFPDGVTNDMMPQMKLWKLTENMINKYNI